MNTRWKTFVALAGLVAAGCKTPAPEAPLSPEAQADRELAQLVPLFHNCMTYTSQTGVTPGEHRCSTILSLVIDMKGRNHHIAPAAWAARVDQWVTTQGFTGYYLPPGSPLRQP